jgi:hypothetical protein
VPEDPFGTIPMFEVPKKYRPPERLIEGPVWKKYVGKRTSCDDCIAALAKGESQFASAPAAHVRTSPEGRGFYCRTHSIRRKERDDLEGRT